MYSKPKSFVSINVIGAKFLLALCACLSFSNCSETIDSSNLEQMHGLERADAVSIFLARNSMNETDFEQFQLKNSTLFYECGKIKRGRTFPSMQNILNLSDQKSEHVLVIADLLRRYLDTHEQHLPSPGRLVGLTDPGKAVVAVLRNSSSQEVHTSVAQIALGTDKLTNSLRATIESIRRMVKEENGERALCNNERFYGIH